MKAIHVCGRFTNNHRGAHGTICDVDKRIIPSDNFRETSVEKHLHQYNTPW